MRFHFLTPWLSIAAVVLISATALAGLLNGTVSGARMVAAYLLLMLLPGAAFSLSLTRAPSLITLLLHTLMSSPLLSTAAAVLLLLAGVPPQATVASIILASALFTIIVLAVRSGWRIEWECGGRQLLLLLGVAALFCALAGYLPLTSEWWRMRSDAWFHAAVIAEIDSYGLPPQDPYFAGLPLQYMWFYHVMIFLVSRASSIEPFMVMPLVNLQALAGFILATFLLSLRLAGSKRRFGYALASVLVAVLGMNALFWLFLPVKLLRAFIGEVTMMDEVRRILSLTPLDKNTAREFMTIYMNQVFFLDKFMVSTAFSLGLAYMALFWSSVTDYLGRRMPRTLWMVFFSTIGMLLFHSAVGFVLGAGLCGGLLLLFLLRGSTRGYSFKSSLLLAGTVFAGLVVSAPYLYMIMHAKEASNAIPFGLSFAKFVGFFISCALTILLAFFQVKPILNRREPQEYYLLFAALSVTIFSLVVVLPTSNTFDKLPFFIYFPLAVAGGWTVLDWARRARPGIKRTSLTICLFVVLLLPANVIALLGYYNTPTQELISPAERKTAAWVGANTTRDAVFLDSHDRVFLLVTGPRRYYWGNITYAEQWGYDFGEMAKRKHVRDNLYSDDAIDTETIEALSGIEHDVYLVVREPDEEQAVKKNGAAKPAPGMEKFGRYPALLEPVFSAGEITLLRVNKEACRAWIELREERR